MNEKRQSSWGWLVAIYVFLAGVGGGTFLCSYILDCLDRYGSVAKVGALTGPLLVLAGALFLLFDLGSATKAFRLFTAPSTLMSSWMSRGAWILTAFIILGLTYALPAFSLFEWLPLSGPSSLRQSIGALAALLSIGVVIYPGFLFGVLKSVPFWNTSALPLLFFVSGLETGIAVLVLIDITISTPVVAAGLHVMGAVDTALIVLLAIVLGAYIEIVRHSGVTAGESVQLLKRPLFIYGVLILGLLLPLGLLVGSLSLFDPQSLPVVAGLADVLLLSGGLLLRYSVIEAGVPMTAR